MQTISRKFPSRAEATLALKAADAALVSTGPDGVDRIVGAGLDAQGARFDVVVTDLVVRTGRKVAGPAGAAGPLFDELAPSGEVQVDIFWQGLGPPMIADGVDVEEPAVALEPPSAVPTSALPDQISWLDFMGLFTPAEQAAVATSVDPSVAVFRMMTTGLGGDMNLADPRVGYGLDALVAAGLIAAARKWQVLARQEP